MITSNTKLFLYLKIKLLFCCLLIPFLLLSTAKANDNKKDVVGFITEIDGSVIKKIDETQVKLGLYDQIFLNEKIEIETNSSVTFLFNDNSILTLKEESVFEVSQYDDLSLKQKFIISILKGAFVVESGNIAKSDGGRMTLIFPKSEIDLKGTRVGGDVSADGKKESVYLVEDSFGNIGQIVITSETGDIQQISNVNEGMILEEGKELSRESLEEDNQLEIFSDFKEAVINSTKVDEKAIAKEMTQRLAEGTMIDQNGDGKVDLADVDIISDSVKNEFSARLDYVIESSTEADTSLIADVMDASDTAFAESIMETIVNDNPDMVVGLVENLVEQKSEVIFSGDNSELQEKIFANVIANDVENDFEVLSSIISQGDQQVSSMIMSQIMEESIEQDPLQIDPTAIDPTAIDPTAIDPTAIEDQALTTTTSEEMPESKAALMVLSALSEKMFDIHQDEPEEEDRQAQVEYMIELEEQFSEFTSYAIEHAEAEDSQLITDVLINADEGLSEMIFDELSSDEMEDNMLVAAVFEDMVQEDFNVIENLNSELKEELFEKVIVAVQEIEEEKSYQVFTEKAAAKAERQEARQEAKEERIATREERREERQEAKEEAKMARLEARQERREGKSFSASISTMIAKGDEETSKMFLDELTENDQSDLSLNVLTDLTVMEDFEMADMAVEDEYFEEFAGHAIENAAMEDSHLITEIIEMSSEPEPEYYEDEVYYEETDSFTDMIFDELIESGNDELTTEVLAETVSNDAESIDMVFDYLMESGDNELTTEVFMEIIEDEDNLEAITMLSENEELYEEVVESFDEEMIEGAFELDVPTTKAEIKAEKKATKATKKEKKLAKKEAKLAKKEAKLGAGPGPATPADTSDYTPGMTDTEITPDTGMVDDLAQQQQMQLDMMLAQQEADRIAQEEADRIAEEEYQMMLAQEEADRIAQEEADRLAQEEDERLYQEWLDQQEADLLATRPSWDTEYGTGSFQIGTYTANEWFSDSFTASSNSDVTYEIRSNYTSENYESGLPPGLSLDFDSGEISGTLDNPTEDKTYEFRYRATDIEGQNRQRLFMITVERVSESTAPTWVTLAYDDFTAISKENTKLADLNAVEPLSVYIQATSNADPVELVRYEIPDYVNGLYNELPMGLSLDFESGEISGTPDLYFPPENYETYIPFKAKAYDEGSDPSIEEQYALREFAFYIPDMWTYNDTPN